MNDAPTPTIDEAPSAFQLLDGVNTQLAGIFGSDDRATLVLDALTGILKPYGADAKVALSLYARRLELAAIINS